MSSSGKIVNLVNPTNAQDAATKTYVDTSIPIGGIIMWSGTTGTSLPSNWKLCDGSTYNSITTPDLRGRFVLSSTTPTSANGNIALGAGLTARNVTATGGAETVTLTTAQMPTHGHGVSAKTAGDAGGTVDGKHTHGHTWSAGIPPNIVGTGIRGFPVGGNVTDGTALTINDTGSGHNHTITVTQSNAGSDNPHENMPPFYVLAFIMRVS